MPKIRKATPRSDSLEITMPTGGKKGGLDARPLGYSEGEDADWEFKDGVLVLKLRPKQKGAKVDVPVESGIEVVGDAGNIAKTQ